MLDHIICFATLYNPTAHLIQHGKVKAIPIYLKNKDGTDGTRARMSYQRFNNFVFAAYCIIIYGTYVFASLEVCNGSYVI